MREREREERKWYSDSSQGTMKLPRVEEVLDSRARRVAAHQETPRSRLGDGVQARGGDSTTVGVCCSVFVSRGSSRGGIKYIAVAEERRDTLRLILSVDPGIGSVLTERNEWSY